MITIITGHVPRNVTILVTVYVTKHVATLVTGHLALYLTTIGAFNCLDKIFGLTMGFLLYLRLPPMLG